MIVLARWWNETGKPEPAAMIVGCATAHNVIDPGLDELTQALDAPALEPALQRGRQMSRDALLEHVTAELAPVAIGGVVDA